MPEGIEANVMEKLPISVKIGRSILTKQNPNIFDEMADLFAYMLDKEPENTLAIASQFNTISSSISSSGGQLDMQTTFLASLHPEKFNAGDNVKILDDNQIIVGSGKFHSTESTTSCRVVLHQIKNAETILPIPNTNFKVLGDCSNNLGKVTISWLSSQVSKCEEELSKSTSAIINREIISTPSGETQIELLVLQKELE
jgi:hypothetical protein